MSGYDSGDYDNYLVGQRERMHVARKEHICTACDATIRPGDKYCYHSQVYTESGVDVVKRCMKCEYIYRTLCADLASGRLCGDFVHPNLDCGHEYSDTHKAPMPAHLERIAFMTDDELQRLDFTALDQDLELGESRRNEIYSRRCGYFDEAAKRNANTCRLESAFRGIPDSFL